MADQTRPFVDLKIQGSSMGLEVRLVEVEDNDRLIDQARIVVDDPNRPYTDFVQEGQTVLVDLGWTTEHAVLFEGVVTRVSGEATREGRRQVTITALDLSKKMDRQQRSENHTGTLSSIVRRVAGRAEYGIPIGDVLPDPDPSFAEPLRQSNETDWHFLQRLAEAYGARTFVEYNEGRSKFYFVALSRLRQGDPMGSLTYCQGFSQLTEFRYDRIASAAAPQRTASVESPATGVPATSPTPTPAPPEAPAAPDAGQVATLTRAGGGVGESYAAAGAVAATATERPADQRPRTVVAGTPSDPALPQRVTIQDPTQILGLRGQGLAVGTIKLRAKGKVSIHGIAVWDEGDWYVRQATHVYRREPVRRPNGQTENVSTYHTRFVVTR
ncbi:MAG TPA: contractile injection system protein, VgrG/Pvc8 family [Chloroflexota bacterium]|jgi:phage protein D